MRDRNFYRVFLRTLPWRPRQALGALYWHVTGRRVRARNRLRIVAEQSPLAYPLWIETVERNEDVLASADDLSSGWRVRPHYSIVIDGRSPSPKAVSQSIASVVGQRHADWELLLCVTRDVAVPPFPSDSRIRTIVCPTGDPVGELPRALDTVTGDYLLPLPAGAVLPPTALFRYTEALQVDPEADLLFGDQDRTDARGSRSQPWFKPRWNEEMILAQDYISQACTIRAEAARDALKGMPDAAIADAYAIILTISSQAGARIVHVPHIQCHLPDTAAPDLSVRSRAVANHLAARQPGATLHSGPFDTLHVSWPLPAVRPLVSIIVPTRDKVKLLRACVSGVLERTDYDPFELIIADNGSSEADALAYLQEIARHSKVRVLPYDRPYNFSAINNFAVGHARGEYLCLLNNDTEVIDETWLSELMRQAIRPQIGAVGAKLLYADRSIQHAGVVVGLGEAAGHAHRFLRNGEPGYFRQAHIAQFMTAVTAACLVVEKSKYSAVGGLDEEGLQIAFNDVDLCLKLQQAGWHNVYAPKAVMIHHESKSRGKDISPQHIDRYLRELAVLQGRWGTKTYADPLHHPNLDRASETFVLRL